MLPPPNTRSHSQGSIKASLRTLWLVALVLRVIVLIPDYAPKSVAVWWDDKHINMDYIIILVSFAGAKVPMSLSIRVFAVNALCRITVFIP